MSGFRALLCVWLLLIAQVALARPVLLISIDGLRPAELQSQNSAAPNLRKLAITGSYSGQMRATLPTLTYPAHTTMITGASPAHHGIGGNEAFDPIRRNQEGWMWYAGDITVGTLWQAAHARGLTTAAINWPVTVGAPIDWNVPQYWRAGTDDDVKLLAALSTPGLAAWLERKTGRALPNPRDASPAADLVRMDHTAVLIEARHPALLALHIDALDHASHDFGPDSPEARGALGAIDGGIGKLLARVRRASPDTVVIVVSDHGFVPVSHFINIEAALRGAGLLTTNADGDVTDWKAAVWQMSGSAAIVLKDPNDKTTGQAAAKLLEELASDPANGIASVLTRKQIAANGGSNKAAFWVAFKPGFAAGGYASGPLRQESWLKGTHGYLPESAGMEAAFLASGKKVVAGKNLGPMDMRQVAPTVASILGVRLRDAELPAMPVF